MSDVKEAVTNGLEEMGYELVDNGVMELPASTPATYDLDGDTSLDIEGFESALDEHDFNTLRPNTGEKEDGRFYCYVDIVTDHYKKVHVKVWNDSVGVYPKEELPDRYELSRILHAIEDGFGGEIRNG